MLSLLEMDGTIFNGFKTKKILFQLIRGGVWNEIPKWTSQLEIPPLFARIWIKSFSLWNTWIGFSLFLIIQLSLFFHCNDLNWHFLSLQQFELKFSLLTTIQITFLAKIFLGRKIIWCNIGFWNPWQKCQEFWQYEFSNLLPFLLIHCLECHCLISHIQRKNLFQKWVNIKVQSVLNNSFLWRAAWVAGVDDVMDG